MTDDDHIRLELPGHFIDISIRDLRSLIANVIRSAGSMPVAPALTTKFAADPNPAKSRAFQVSQIEGEPELARLSIVVGPFDLQVAVPLVVLLEQLEMLREATEAFPRSGPRLN